MSLEAFKLPTVFEGNTVVHGSAVWTWKRNLGSGTYGAVYLEESKQGPGPEESAFRAVKVLTKTRQGVKYLREIRILAAVADRDDLFVKFMGWYENHITLHIAMEYIERGDLSQHIGKRWLTEVENIKDVTRQLLQGLSVLHSRKICHRDLKPQNVLIASTNPVHVKIADFGISKAESTNTQLHTSIGTSGYLAPEVIPYMRENLSEFKRGRIEYTNAVDMWALGCILHEVLTDAVPFVYQSPSNSSGTFEDYTGIAGQVPQQEIDVESLRSFCTGTTKLQLLPEMLKNYRTDLKEDQKAACDFVLSLLVANPSARMSVEKGLNSPWLTSFGGHERWGPVIERAYDELQKEVGTSQLLTGYYEYEEPGRWFETTQAKNGSVLDKERSLQSNWWHKSIYKSYQLEQSNLEEYMFQWGITDVDDIRIPRSWLVRRNRLLFILEDIKNDKWLW